MAKKTKTNKKRLHSGTRAVRKVARKTASKRTKKGKASDASGSKGAALAGKDAGDLSSVLPRMQAVILRHHARESLTWTHGLTRTLLGGWPADRWTHQPSPSDNHALWTVGHMATVYSWFASLVDGKPADIPPEYQGAFGYKSKPVDDPSAYPPVDAVIAVHERAFERLLAAVDGLTPEQVLSACAAESHGLCATRLDVLHRAVWHEGWHQGQLAGLRKALGMPSVM